MTTLSELVKFRSATSRYQAGVITRIESGDTCSLIVLGDGSDWEDTVTATVYARPFYSIAKGTGVGQWQPADVDEQTAAAISAAIAGLASTSYVDTAIAGIPATDLSGCCAVPSAGASQVSLGLDTPRRPSTTRPVLVTATGFFTITSTVLGTQTASVDLLSDSSATPTTPRAHQPARLSGVAATVDVPWSLTYAVPPGHYYQVASAHSANGSVTLSTLNETVL